jgi:hypothetical protein
MFGDVTVTFKTEEEAKRFDEYLESEIVVRYADEEIDRFKIKDKFDAAEFFNIRKD